MMQKIFSGFVLLLFGCSSHLAAQVENVVVETYYISDSNDATDTLGGGVPDRSTTYRIYVDLAPGSKLTEIYGDANHALKISSTEVFFNNAQYGETFAKEILKNKYGKNTVALDSWLTIGQTTRTAAKTYFGVLKPEDDDGSFVGGANNDGGSAAVNGGLLINNDPDAGIPLTTADGMDTLSDTPINWADHGIVDTVSYVDSTIFGSAKPCSSFVSNDAGLQCSGTMGVNRDSNLVLVAQLTTRGELSFELNVVVTDSAGNAMKYVASDSLLQQDEVFTRVLKYPFAQVCGCPDPNYLEYIDDRDCDAQDSCRTLIVFGCMDTMACNYDPNANFNVQALCCYPGFCDDRDLSIVCPSLSYERHQSLAFNLFPNPAHDEITFQSPAHPGSAVTYSIMNSMSEIILEKTPSNAFYPVNMQLNISALKAGIYIFRVEADGQTEYVKFIKY